MRRLCFKPKTPSFSFVTSPSNPRREADSPAIDETIESAAAIINKWNPDATTFARVTSLFYESKEEATEFINRVNQLKRTMDRLVSENPNSEKLGRAQSLMQIAMKRLQKEFYQILSINRAQLDPESVSTRSSRTSARSSASDFADDDDPDDVREAGESIAAVEEASSIAMADLRSIAECMIASGYAKECTSIYKSIRKSIIDEGIYRLGVEKTSSSQAKKMPWEVLELKIKSWLEALTVSMRTLFNGERILCDHVFESADSIRESCFSSISKDGAMLLFGFPEIAAKSKENSPPERIFRLLDMYTAIAEKWQEIEAIFSFNPTSIVRSQALNSLIRLGETIRRLLSNFESGMRKDSLKAVVPGGGVHPLTISVMNYLSLLSDYSHILADILSVVPPPDSSSLPESYFNSTESDESPASDLSIRFAWLILVLLCKIDSKAKRYNDISTLYLFLMNNLQHVVSRTRTSNLKNLLGDDWISRHEEKVRHLASRYVRLAWGPLADSLQVDPSAPAMSPEAAKKRFENFSSALENIYSKQSACVVPDPKLRGEIKSSIVRKLVPIYRQFYNTHLGAVMSSAGKIVRFTPENMCYYLSMLFSAVGPSVNPAASPFPSPLVISSTPNGLKISKS